MVLLVDNIPALRSRFLAYGPRTASDEANHGDTSKPKFESARPAYLSQLLDALNKLQVPHSYFLHFYIVSIASSTFWPPQIYADGRPFRRIASINDVNSWGTGMSADQVLLTWSLMAIQGFRRLMESITLARPSKSKMCASDFQFDSLPALHNGMPHLPVSGDHLRAERSASESDGVDRIGFRGYELECNGEDDEGVV
ncbi:hypothetical protein MMC21_002074 [Puttea exsequens]|nr:hypothetical protein [Puttea exsequens]